MPKNIKKEPSLLMALTPILILIGLLTLNVKIFGDEATLGSNQLALIFASVVATVIATIYGFTWQKIRKGIVKSIKSALPAILILLLIGALSGTWMISGIVPTMIYYGLNILSPTIFLVAACIVSAVVAIATGSSWTTTATVGAALIGIGYTMGMNEGMVAGAIISGAYFGDKMSPLSDTTNLAPAMAGTDLITHIKYMAKTTVPSISITLIIFFFFGFFNTNTGGDSEVNEIMSLIEQNVNVSGWLMLVPLIVVVLIIKKVSAIPALFVGTLLGAVAAAIAQPELIEKIAGHSQNYWVSSYKTGVMAMARNVSIIGGENLSGTEKRVAELLETGGMVGMLKTIWLIMCAMAFGGVMEVSGMLDKITRSIMTFVKSTGSLIATTVGTCVFFNATASDQYLAIVVPGRMFSETYKDKGLAPENLSRTLEDSGTVTSVLFPWNTCGAAQSRVLDVSVESFAFYSFFNWISPIMTMIFGIFNIGIRKLKPKKKVT